LRDSVATPIFSIYNHVIPLGFGNQSTFYQMKFLQSRRGDMIIESIERPVLNPEGAKLFFIIHAIFKRIQNLTKVDSSFIYSSMNVVVLFLQCKS
ncbi:MAG: hypothetical protein WCP32_12835, partial [Bacteroidota bacterium]